MRRAGRFGGSLAAVVCSLWVVLAGVGTASAATARSAGLVIKVPSGWTTSVLPAPGGVLVADSRADLFAARVSGARLTAQPSATIPSPQSLVTAIDRGALFNPVITPENVGRFTNVPVVRFQTSKSSKSGMTVEILALTVAPGKAYLFTLEGATSKWRSAQSILETMVSTAVFNTAAFPH